MKPIACLALILSVLGPYGVNADETKTTFKSEQSVGVDQLPNPQGIPGGLCVQLGGGDGSRTVELAREGRFLVHRLENDQQRVRNLHRFLESNGLYGPISVEHWTEKTLPYVDNLVNVVVADDLMGIPESEILRVLCPRGVAYIRDGQRYKVIRKPRPKGMDEWTHQWHGPDGGLVSDDKHVGTPTGVQWISGPLFAMDGRKSSTQSLVSAGGRNFYITQNTVENIGLGKMGQYLVVRDAFNGLLLWKRPWTGPFVTGNGETSSRIVAIRDRVYIVGSKATLGLDAATGKQVATYPSPELPRKLIYDDGILLLESNNQLTAYEAESAKRLWSVSVRNSTGTVLSNGRVFCLSRRRVKTGELVFDAVAFDLQTGKKQWQINTQQFAHGRNLRITFAQAGYLAIQSHGAMHLLSAKNGELLWSAMTSDRPGKSYADERYVGHFYRSGLVWMRNTTSVERPVGTKSGSRAQHVRALEIATGKSLKGFEGHTAGVNAVVYSPDGRFIATACGDKTAVVWDAATGKPVKTLRHSDNVNDVAFSPDGELLVTACDDKAVRLWDVATAKIRRRLNGHNDGVNCVVFSPDGKIIASGSDDKTVLLWTVVTGGKIRVLKRHADSVNRVAFSPDGKTLASCGEENFVILWKVSTGKPRLIFDKHTDEIGGLAFSPDGRFVASGSDDKTVILWDAATGRVNAVLNGHTNDVKGMAFSPDGKSLASGDDDGNLISWDLSKRTRRTTYQGPKAGVTSVAFSPDGRTLIAVGEDTAATSGSEPSFGKKDKQLAWVGRDPATGKVKRTVRSFGDWPRTASLGKLGCQLMIATDRYFMIPRQATFIGVGSGEKETFKFARGGCGLGMVPANGLTYVHPHACGCFSETLRGFIGMNSNNHVGLKPDAASRLWKGPAYGTPRTELATDNRNDWPTYRHDLRRSGVTPVKLPAKLGTKWSVSIGGTRDSRSMRAWRLRVGNPITAPVVAEGKVFAAEIDAHRLVAVDDKTGKPIWTFTAGGRIDSPPTIYRGLCLFGSHDGSVYCLRAKDGKLIWRFLAASSNRRIIAFGQLESIAPVTGSVLIHQGTAFVAAGRAPDADAGIRVYGLDPETGAIRWTKPVGDRFSGLCDYLVGDGKSIFLSNWQFEPKIGANKQAAEGAAYLRGGKVGLLEASWTRMNLALRKNIQDWTYGTATGQLLVFSSSNVFGYRSDGSSGALFAQGKTKWSAEIAPPNQVEAMLKAGNMLVVAGPSDRSGRQRDGFLHVLSTIDGSPQSEMSLPAPPVYDGLAAANEKLYVATQNGKLICMEGR